MSERTVSPQDLREYSTNLKNTTNTMDEILTTITSEVTNLSTAWQDTAGNMYRDKYTNLSREITDALALLRDYASRVDAVARLWDENLQKNQQKVNGLSDKKIY